MALLKSRYSVNSYYIIVDGSLVGVLPLSVQVKLRVCKLRAGLLSGSTVEFALMTIVLSFVAVKAVLGVTTGTGAVPNPVN